VRPHIAAGAIGIFVVANAARAQSVLYEFSGANAGDIADRVATLGDVDGDGTADFAIGAGLDDTSGLNAGAVRLYSGASGALLDTIQGAAGDELGRLVLVKVGDLDGDGTPDFMTGAPRLKSSGPGSIYVYSGATRALLYQFDQSAIEFSFGLNGAAAGDVDGDGVADFAFTTGEYVGPTFRGQVLVWSGLTGALLTFYNDSKTSFGSGLAGIGDVDGDGHAELLVGSPAEDSSSGTPSTGRAFIYSGRDGSLLRSHDGAQKSDRFGIRCAALGDLDGDGIADYAIGSSPGPTFLDGSVYVYSGASGALLTQLTSSADQELVSLGAPIADAGDVDRDGISDLLVGGQQTIAPGGRTVGAGFLFSGRSFALLHHFTDVGEPVAAVSAAADLDGDGFGDVLVGFTGASSEGVALACRGNDLWLDASPRDPMAQETLTLATRDGTPGNLTVLAIVAINGAPTFVIVGGLGQFDSTGSRILAGTVPTGLSGVQLELESFADGSGGGVVASAVETVTFQ
jgi:FG-GAP repeat protein